MKTKIDEIRSELSRWRRYQKRIMDIEKAQDLTPAEQRDAISCIVSIDRLQSLLEQEQRKQHVGAETRYVVDIFSKNLCD